MAAGAAKKPLAPSKDGVAMDAGFRRRSAYTLAVYQGLGVEAPRIAVPQTRQRRSGQRVECPATRVTLIALQAIVMAKGLRRPHGTVRTIRHAGYIQFPSDCQSRIGGRQSGFKSLLRGCTQRQKTCQPCIKLDTVYRYITSDLTGTYYILGANGYRALN